MHRAYPATRMLFWNISTVFAHVSVAENQVSQGLSELAYVSNFFATASQPPMDETVVAHSLESRMIKSFNYYVNNKLEGSGEMVKARKRLIL